MQADKKPDARRWHKIPLAAIAVLCISAGTANQGDTDTDPPRLRKPAGFADEGIGVMTKGQLHNLTMNYGQITDTRFEDVGNAPTDTHFDFRWPATGWTGLCDDFSIIFARRQNSKNGDNGNVIDGYTDNNNEDWIAKDGAWGATHYNAALDPTSSHEPLLYEGSVPYLAHSDLPDTWPVAADGTAFWPGYFRKHPDTGEEVFGEFASDRDIYAVFTDAHNQQGPPLGLVVEMMAYNYGRLYAEDIHFYEFYIKNTSSETLDSCWVGYYMDPDCSDHGEETLLLPDPTFSNPDVPDIIGDRDFDGDLGGATRPNARGVLEDMTFGIAIMETPKNLGVTSFHYFEDPGPTDDRQLWPIIASNPTDRDIAAFADQYFHGSDPNLDDVSLINAKGDLVFIVASGPFDLAPGEVVKSTVAVAVGENDADFYANMAQAQEMFDKYFQGPTAPPPPKLFAVAGDRQVTLYWDDLAESLPDQTTGEFDFEGYKVFRSEDGGASWGRAITDSRGQLVGYVPVAQFDLDNGITGNDPLNSFNYLGNDTGIRHSWVDTRVNNGVRYSYTIVSYDRGTPDKNVPSFEAARGSGDADRNFASATPRTLAQGHVAAQTSELRHAAGKGKGEVLLEIIDEGALKIIEYGIGFNASPARTFRIFETASGRTLLDDLPVNVDDLPVVAGFRASVITDAVSGGVKSITDGYGKDVWGAGKADSSGSWLVSVVERNDASLDARASDYEIRFTESGAMAYTWGLNPKAAFHVPFEVWNMSERPPRQVVSEVLDANNSGTWEEGENTFIVNAPYPAEPPAVGDPIEAPFPAVFPMQVLIANAPGDAARRPPQTGDRVVITTFRSFAEDDQFAFRFAPASANAAAVNLTKVRVVPNPYIVSAAWEEIENARKIRFMFLPPACDIDIYTLNGMLVRTLHHDNGTGDEEWNLLSEWNQDLAFGLYVYVVKTPDGRTQIGKFGLIK